MSVASGVFPSVFRSWFCRYEFIVGDSLFGCKSFLSAALGSNSTDVLGTPGMIVGRRTPGYGGLWWSFGCGRTVLISELVFVPEDVQGAIEPLADNDLGAGRW